jgi:hypothetical protein
MVVMSEMDQCEVFQLAVPLWASTRQMPVCKHLSEPVL